jgi:ABC-type taurine transport system ATPase subunit
MTAYADLAEVRDALKAWGEHSTALLVESAMQEISLMADRLVLLEEIQGAIVSTLADAGAVVRRRL